MVHDFANSDGILKERVPEIADERKALGLNGLVGGLEAVVINTEPDNHAAAVSDFLGFTGHRLICGFEHKGRYSSVLGGIPDSADIIIQSRRPGAGENHFAPYNSAPKAAHLPNTRLETFVFWVKDLEKYVDIQKSRGVQFMAEPVHHENYSFIQIMPSELTGNSIGLVEWKGGQRRDWEPDDSQAHASGRTKPDHPFLSNIGRLDHAATRVRAADRDAAIIEFMRLTNYDFEFAIYVKSLNSITSVTRLSAGDFAMVFTSGISPFSGGAATSGPTEGFIRNYGTRVHHMAFDTKNIEDTFEALADAGMDFLLELVGSPDEGLKQTFSVPFASTLLVNEYIRRYGDFDGFFTKSNVTVLTESTNKQ